MTKTVPGGQGSETHLGLWSLKKGHTMTFISNQRANRTTTVRFRFSGQEQWTVRCGIKNLKAYIESVDNVPSLQDSGSQWHVGNNGCLPEFTSWQVKDTNGNWRTIEQSDLL
mgnify:CR=1 FL=1|tara:strand:- start:12416 stop:12751 length:336 start_codon:yes stop_codon:yes gene_type:complete